MCFMPQSNQETIPLDDHNADLPAGSTPARRSHAAQPDEKGVGACAARKGGHRYGNHPALQLVPTDQLYIDSPPHQYTLLTCNITPKRATFCKTIFVVTDILYKLGQN